MTRPERSQTARRRRWIEAQGPCACGSTDRMRVCYPPDVVDKHNLWGLTQRRLDAILPRLTVKCFACWETRRLARAGTQAATHGTRSMYRRGCRCQACHDVEVADKKARYVPVAVRRQRAQQAAP